MKNKALIILLVIIGVVLVGFGSATYTLKETQQALVLKFGEFSRVESNAGLHWKKPFVENVIYVDKRLRFLDTPELTVFTKDQKQIIVDAFSEFRITDPLAMYRAVQNEGRAERRLAVIINSNLRKVFGQEDFHTAMSGERKTLRLRIKDSVIAEAKEIGLEVVDVRIKRTDLPKDNSEAIFISMKAERNQVAREIRSRGEEQAIKIISKAERERIVILAQAEQKSQILRGEGDAVATKTFADAYGADAEFYAFYRSMEAYKKAMRAGSTNMVLSPDSEFFNYFGNMNGKK